MDEEKVVIDIKVEATVKEESRIIDEVPAVSSLPEELDQSGDLEEDSAGMDVCDDMVDVKMEATEANDELKCKEETEDKISCELNTDGGVKEPNTDSKPSDELIPSTEMQPQQSPKVENGDVSKIDANDVNVEEGEEKAEDVAEKNAQSNGQCIGTIAAKRPSTTSAAAVMAMDAAKEWERRCKRLRRRLKDVIYQNVAYCDEIAAVKLDLSVAIEERKELLKAVHVERGKRETPQHRIPPPLTFTAVHHPPMSSGVPSAPSSSLASSSSAASSLSFSIQSGGNQPQSFNFGNLSHSAQSGSVSTAPIAVQAANIGTGVTGRGRPKKQRASATATASAAAASNQSPPSSGPRRHQSTNDQMRPESVAMTLSELLS